MLDIFNIKKAHFIGIGGSGMSSLAKLFRTRGVEVTGSDAKISPHRKENIPMGVDVVIYTIAIPQDNEELMAAKSSGVPLLTYPEALGLLSQKMFTIAVSGTHGKTTTTNMVGKILADAGLKPMIIVGGYAKETRDLEPGSEYLVVEACEYRRSFLNIHPDILVITNIEADHLDYYKDLADIQNAFEEFKGNLKPNGTVISEYQNETLEKTLKLKVPGKHNVQNALAAISAAKVVGIDEEKAAVSLSDFTGAERRFEYKGKTSTGALVYDDYAHHPTEVAAAIQGAREKFPQEKLTVVFQPHLYSRTKELFGDFVRELSKADQTIVLPIFAAREKFDGSISSEILAKEIPNAKAMEWEDATLYIKTKGEGDVVLTMGAGEAYKVTLGLLVP